MSAVGLPLAVGRARLPAAVRRFLEQECFVVLVLASTLAFVAYAVPTLLVCPKFQTERPLSHSLLRNGLA